uniref:Uncharacterized protein LOC114330897 n=1 Tax=Diabrotica virgifera virgifera TaxID=50390 RepID=A0A6P7FMP4_DIAVI
MSHVLSANTVNTPVVLLSTIQVYLLAPSGKRIYVKALLDQASQVTFVTQNLINQLSTPTFNKQLQITGVNQTVSVSKSTANLTIYFSTNDSRLDISCSILPKITNCLPQLPIMANKLKIPQEMELADSQFHITSDIDILLGAVYYGDIKLGQIIRLGTGLPILQNTTFGFIISGRIPENCIKSKHGTSQYVNNLVTCTTLSSTPESPESQTADENLSQIVQKFWESEEVNPPISESVENHPSELLFLNTVKILPSGRYQVNLNLKHSVDDLHMGNSFITAKKRFLYL